MYSQFSASLFIQLQQIFTSSRLWKERGRGESMWMEAFGSIQSYWVGDFIVYLFFNWIINVPKETIYSW